MGDISMSRICNRTSSDVAEIIRSWIQFSLQEYDNELSRRLNEVVNEIRRQRCSYLR